MQEQLQKICVENFKSLKNFEINLGKFNVLIGANGSGKTNVLELFKFINLCISPVRNPPYPFAPWWGFNNIVWSSKEDLPISFTLQYSMHGTVMNYSAQISGTGGKFLFLSEKYTIKNLVTIVRDFNTVEHTYDKNFLNKNKNKILSMPNINPEILNKLHAVPTYTVSNNISILKHNSGWSASFSSDLELCLGEIGIVKNGRILENIPFITPVIKDNAGHPHPLFPLVQDFLTFPGQILFLRQLNLDVIRQPSFIGKNTALSENGDGLINLLFSWYNKNGGKLPDRITTALEELFSGWQVAFTVTDDGRIMLNVNDGELKLSPTSIPDGFYKLLAILSALELHPKILLIDEVDTSLHASIIEYLIDEFKTSDSTILVTTHSPLVIDLVDLEDLILLERIGTETHSHRVQDPDAMKELLQEKGITTSESWLYAEL